MSAVFQDFAVSISQRRRTCVLDPTTAMSQFGIALANRLSDSLELWLPREFWRLLENSYYFGNETDDLPLVNSAVSSFNFQNQDSAFQVLHEWERLRSESDPANLKLFWVGDGLGESLFPADTDAYIFSFFELLIRSLDKRLKTENILMWAYRDTVALAVTLPSAIILSQINDIGNDNGIPAICLALQDWGLEPVQADSSDEWLELERNIFRQQMVSAGLSKLRWSGLRLAVIHIVAPVAYALGSYDDTNRGFGEDDELGFSSSTPDYWQGAKAFWYPL